MWLRDSLAKDMKEARIVTYGYDSGLVGSRSNQTIVDIASTFQHQLQRLVDRSSEHNSPPTRPVVMLGHSLGGLVIKEAS